MAAFGQQPERVIVFEIRQADRAFERSFTGFEVLDGVVEYGWERAEEVLVDAL